MLNQRVLEESLEKSGAWITKHPTGVVSLQAGGEQFHIFPHPTRWTYRIAEIGQAPYQSGFFARKDVAELVHFVLRWTWVNGVQGVSE